VDDHEAVAGAGAAGAVVEALNTGARDFAEEDLEDLIRRGRTLQVARQTGRDRQVENPSDGLEVRGHQGARESVIRDVGIRRDGQSAVSRAVLRDLGGDL